MSESNKMKDMPVNKLMIQMGIPMILYYSQQRIWKWRAFIGEEVAKKLGIAYYDKNIISQIAEKSGLAPEYIQESAELSPKKGLFAYALAGRDITGKSVEDMVYETQRKVILELRRTFLMGESP